MRIFSLGVALTCVAGAATAATTTPFTDTVTLTDTNWTRTLSVPQFDSSLGTLNSVMITLVGAVAVDAQAESLDPEAAIVTLGVTTTMTASTTGFSDLVTVLPSVSSTQMFTSFDGNLDFAGTSGASVLGLTNSSSDTGTETAGLSVFIGMGSIDIDIEATAETSATGAGNLATIFGSQASAELTVVYDYSPATVPVPAALPLTMAGIGALGFVGRRRRT